VISEAFFQQPEETRRRYPDFYDQLGLFYRQDPAARAQAPALAARS
jgi:Mlc titration factor MtfA (ptsG expression regulator)